MRGRAEEVFACVFGRFGARAHRFLVERKAERSVDQRELFGQHLVVQKRQTAGDRLQVEVELLADAAAEVIPHAVSLFCIELVVAGSVFADAADGGLYGASEELPGHEAQIGYKAHGVVYAGLNVLVAVALVAYLARLRIRIIRGRPFEPTVERLDDLEHLRGWKDLAARCAHELVGLEFEGVSSACWALHRLSPVSRIGRFSS